MRPSDVKKQQVGLKPTKPINVNEQKMLKEMDDSIDKNWQPKGNHPDKKNFKFQ